MATILEKSGFNPDKKLKIVGSSPVKQDGLDKVTGRAKFGADTCGCTSPGRIGNGNGCQPGSPWVDDRATAQ